MSIDKSEEDASIYIKTSLAHFEARPNVIIDGKLYIPKNHTEVFIDKYDGKEKLRFIYQDLGYDWRGPHCILGIWGDDCTFTTKRFAQMLKIKGYYKMKKAELARNVWSRIVLE